MIETSLLDYLATALPGVRVESRLPQKGTVQFPVVVYQVVSSKPVYNLAGASGLTSSVVHFHCWADTKLEAMNLAESLRMKLSGFHGMMGTTSVGQTVLQNQYEIDPAFNDEGSDTSTFRYLAEYKIYYVETIPTFA